MVKDSSIDISYLESLPTKQFVNHLLLNVYSILFKHISKIILEIDELSNEQNKAIANAEILLLIKEYNALLSEEELQLFPYILTLEEEQKKSENCKEFKKAKHHYVTILSIIIEFKKKLASFTNELDNESVTFISSLLNSLEQKTIQIHLLKDKHLIAKFKTCSGCKSLA